MKTSLVFLPSYLMLFCLISSMIHGEIRDDGPTMNERKIMLKMSEPITRLAGKRLKNDERNAELNINENL